MPRSILKPIGGLLGPGVTGIVLMQEVVSRFRPFARLFISAAITSALYRQVQCFGNAGVGGVTGGPLDNLPAEIVSRRSKASEHRIFFPRRCSLRSLQEAWAYLTCTSARVLLS